jgi:ribosomal protein L11 methyltransferase
MAGYWELALALSDDVEEGLTNFLWDQGALGVIAEQVGGDRPRLRAFFADDVDRGRLEARLTAYLAGLEALGFAAPRPARLTLLADGNWAEAWREHFRPLAVGRRVLVAPPWAVPPDAGRIAIVIEPGRAFGTGHHASTAGCLQALEALVDAAAPPAAAIDLGTGSGILAIAAARFGVGCILAVDDDPDALACAGANAALNGVADRVRFLRADAAGLPTAPVPLVLANLLTAAHVRLAADYARYVAGDGALVLGGILDSEGAAVTATLASHGFAAETAPSQEGWTTLVFSRRGASPPLRRSAGAPTAPSDTSPRTGCAGEAGARSGDVDHERT